VKVRVLGCCGRAGVTGFGLVLWWLIWLEWAREALSNGGIFKKIGAVLSFRFVTVSPLPVESTPRPRAYDLFKSVKITIIIIVVIINFINNKNFFKKDLRV
jgi:hypothetical protein